MLLGYIKASVVNWNSFFKSFFLSVGSFFVFLEAYEVLNNTDVPLRFDTFISISFILSVFSFIADGLLFSGFYRNKVELCRKSFGSKVTIEFGDIFTFEGWKAIGVNDFFDSIVDEKVISSATLHGHTLKRYWANNINQWDKEVYSELLSIESEELQRKIGKNIRYNIGTTAGVTVGTEKFLFVALSKTSIEDGVTTANAENIICATRGLLKKARSSCSNQPLIIPLLGSGLARAGIANNVLLDLILCGIYEEAKCGKITDEIKVILHPSKRVDFDLLAVKKKWN